MSLFGMFKKKAPEPPAPKPAPEKPERYVQTEFSDWIFSPDPVPEEILDELNEVQLAAEPDNEYDKNAIMVMSGDVKLGYLFKGEMQKAGRKALKSGKYNAYVEDVDKGKMKTKKFIWITIDLDV